MLRAFRLRPRRERFPVAPFPTGVSAPAPAGSCWVSFRPSTSELSPSSLAEEICQYGGIEVSAWSRGEALRSGGEAYGVQIRRGPTAKLAAAVPHFPWKLRRPVDRFDSGDDSLCDCPYSGRFEHCCSRLALRDPVHGVVVGSLRRIAPGLGESGQNQVIAARLTRASVSPVPSVVFREALLVQPPDTRSREAVLGRQGAPRRARGALLRDLRGRYGIQGPRPPDVLPLGFRPREPRS